MLVWALILDLWAWGPQAYECPEPEISSYESPSYYRFADEARREAVSILPFPDALSYSIREKDGDFYFVFEYAGMKKDKSFEIRTFEAVLKNRGEGPYYESLINSSMGSAGIKILFSDYDPFQEKVTVKYAVPYGIFCRGGKVKAQVKREYFKYHYSADREHIKDALAEKNKIYKIPFLGVSDYPDEENVFFMDYLYPSEEVKKEPFFIEDVYESISFYRFEKDAFKAAKETFLRMKEYGLYPFYFETCDKDSGYSFRIYYAARNKCDIKRCEVMKISRFDDASEYMSEYEAKKAMKEKSGSFSSAGFKTVEEAVVYDSNGYSFKLSYIEKRKKNNIF